MNDACAAIDAKSSPGFTLRVTAAVTETMRSAAASAWPEECCGLLLGRRSLTGHDGHNAIAVLRACPADNAAPAGQRRHRYRIAPAQWLALERETSGSGLDIVGVYHSHPGGPAAPSGTDLAQAWPELVYVIVTSGDEGAGEQRAWRCVTGPWRFIEGAIVPCNEFNRRSKSL